MLGGSKGYLLFLAASSALAETLPAWSFSNSSSYNPSSSVEIAPLSFHYYNSSYMPSQEPTSENTTPIESFTLEENTTTEKELITTDIVSSVSNPETSNTEPGTSIEAGTSTEMETDTGTISEETSTPLVTNPEESSTESSSSSTSSLPLEFQGKRDDSQAGFVLTVPGWLTPFIANIETFGFVYSEVLIYIEGITPIPSTWYSVFAVDNITTFSFLYANLADDEMVKMMFVYPTTEFGFFVSRLVLVLNDRLSLPLKRREELGLKKRDFVTVTMDATATVSDVFSSTSDTLDFPTDVPAVQIPSFSATPTSGAISEA
ncbi:uncharacterized protein KQ657_003925, partial [Scheffersomyces spartinae]